MSPDKSNMNKEESLTISPILTAIKQESLGQVAKFSLSSLVMTVLKCKDVERPTIILKQTLNHKDE